MGITFVETYLGCDIYYVTPPDAYEAIYRSSCIVGDYFKISAVKKRICEAQNGFWDGTSCALCGNPFPWATESPYEGKTVVPVGYPHRGWGIYYLNGPGVYGIVDPFCVDKTIFFVSDQSARNKIDELILGCVNPFPWAKESPYEGATVRFAAGYLGWGIYYLSGPGLYGILNPFCGEVFFHTTVQLAMYKINELAESRTFTVIGYKTPAGELSSFGSVTLDGVYLSGAGKTRIDFYGSYVGRHAVKLSNIPSGYTFDRWESIVGGSWVPVLIENPNNPCTWITAQKGGPGGLQAWLTAPMPTSATVTVKGRATGGYPIPTMRLYVYDKGVQVGYKDFSPISIGAWYTYEKIVTGAGGHQVYGRMVLVNPLNPAGWEWTTATKTFELG